MQENTEPLHIESYVCLHGRWFR